MLSNMGIRPSKTRPNLTAQLRPITLSFAIMGNSRDTFEAFVQSIPDSKLEGLPENTHKPFADQNFRLNMQGVSG